MASRITTRFTVAERAVWVAAYSAALSGLVHRRVKPTMVGRFCEEHADVALDSFRAKFTKGNGR